MGWRLPAITVLALLAFAGNSLLCRIALRDTAIDPASFTGLRLASGALALWLILRLRRQPLAGQGSWASALALFGYAAAFSFAYLQLDAGTGALILFGAVQACMIGVGLWRGERFRSGQWLGLGLAMLGLLGLLLPGASAPAPGAALLMLLAGLAWGVYSLRGVGGADPVAVTAGNFLRAVPLALGLSLLYMPQAKLDAAGAIYAVVSGALASGLGYVLWYAALASLRALTAASLQLAVPAIAALGGVLLLGEDASLRLLLAAVAILGGIGLVIRGRARQA
jgi:drug/metabolite transporter (DMT)-like permease